MADNLQDAALEIGLSPVKSTTVDGNSAVAQDMDEIKKAAHFVAANSAKSQPHFGLRMTALVPPGCG